MGNNDSTYELDTIEFIAGNFNNMEFTVKDGETGELLDLSTFSGVRWVLFPYGDPDSPILNLLGEVVSTDYSKFIVYIKSEYTKGLEGLYVQQPVLIDNRGKEFRPAQGYVNIIARGNGDNSVIVERNNTLYSV